MIKTHNPLLLSSAILLATACLLLLIAGQPAMAQSPLGIGTAEPAISTGGFLPEFFAWVNTQQQAFYRALTGALQAMRDNPWNLWSLVGLSFAYGVFHAAGPGHGKAVISAYMVANEVALRRGVFLSFVSALLQGAVAMLVVGAAYFLLRGTAISMTDATRFLEIGSFGLIAVFGAWLLLRKLSRLRPLAVPVMAPAMAHAGHGHDHHHHRHHHGHDHADHHHHHHDDVHHRDHGHEHGHPHHHHHDHHDGCSACGHAHAPDPARLSAEKLRLRDAWTAVAAVGLRPCSGALIVLTFALLNGLYLGGILSVLAMSIGTAITVSALATMAVSAKGAAIRYSGSGAAAKVTDTIEIAGAACVMILGMVLLAAALSA
jgi:nickel/cobalt transporter (NicO) family protein